MSATFITQTKKTATCKSKGDRLYIITAILSAFSSQQQDCFNVNFHCISFSLLSVFSLDGDGDGDGDGEGDLCAQLLL